MRRRGADETRLVPLGRGEGRGAPHEIHDRRLQGLGQVLLVHGVGSSPRPGGGGWVVYGGSRTLVGIGAGVLVRVDILESSWCPL